MIYQPYQVSVWGSHGRSAPIGDFNRFKIFDYHFINWDNPNIPDGVTFGGCTSAISMFSGVKNLHLPESVTFENLLNASSMFYTTSDSNLYLPNAVFGKVTNLQHFVGNSGGGFRMTVDFPVATFERVTNATYAFLSAKVLRLPSATFASLSNASNIFGGETVEFDLSSATFISATTASPMFNRQLSQKLRISLPAATLERVSNFSNLMGTPNACITNLHSINMQNATSATGAFTSAELDLQSVQRIAQTIAERGNSPVIDIGIAKELEGTQEIGEALARIHTERGWVVNEHYN